MTDIGTKLLALLTSEPGAWEYREICDGLAHARTGILITPSIDNRVIVMAGGVVCTSVLTQHDHVSLYAVAAPLVEARKEAACRLPRDILCELLGLEKS